MLVVFAGLPGVGKTTIARELARQVGAVYVRADSIEQAIRSANVVPGSLDDAGYRAGYAVAADNLALGHTVVADSVNPWMLTRDAWRAVGVDAGRPVLEVEVMCSDANEHRRRVETRIGDVPGLVLPDWKAVRARDYHAWTRECVVIDSSAADVQECVARVRSSMAGAAATDRKPPAASA